MKKVAKLLLLTLFCICLAAGLTSCKKNYELSFETNGGSAIETIKAEEGKEIELPVPVREGFEFQGWFENESFSGSAVEKITPTEKKTYYAKWVRVYVLTLDANGGTLSTKTLSVKAGEILSELLKDITPTKSNLQFGGWFNGEKAVSGREQMPASDLTLKAKYKAEYTIELHIKNEGSDTEEIKTERGYAFVGETLTMTDDYEGLSEIETENSVTTITVSENSANNIFKRYFTREKVSLLFREDQTGGTSSGVKSIEASYGEEITAPVGLFERKGYWLIGWTDGENVYSTGKKCYNDEAVEAPAKIPVTGNKVYTAVWLKGYADVFKGEDFVYVFENEPKVAYLSRGGFIFKGKRTEKKNTFIFELDNEEKDVVLDGKLLDDGTFTYAIIYRPSQVKQRSLYTLKDKVNRNITVRLDDFNGITYSDGGDESEGTFTIDENGQYVATFTSGTLKGKTLVMIFDTVEETDEQGNATKVEIFRVRNEEEYNTGKLLRGVVLNGSLTFYLDGYYTIAFNGFGIAAYYVNKTASSYYCEFENDKITLTDADGKVFLTAKKVEIKGQDGKNTSCYMLYDEALDGTFTNKDGASLELDGLYKATVKNGTTTVTGNYETKKSVFGGYIVTVTYYDAPANKNIVYKCLLSEKKKTSGGEVIGGEGEDETSDATEIEYELKLKASGYREYYFRDSDSVYYSPVLVFDDETEGKASLYGYTETKEYVLISTGTYTEDETTRRFKYIVTKSFEIGVDVKLVTNPLDARTVTECEFYTVNSATGGTWYNVCYWYSYATKNGTHTEGETFENGDDKLVLLHNYAAYTSEKENIFGTFTSDGNIITVSTATGGKRLFELNLTDNTFTCLDGEIYTAMRYLPDGSLDDKETITTDGKGGAVYTAEGKAPVSGRVEVKPNPSRFNATVYKFTSDEGLSFEYILLYNAVTRIFAVYNKNFDKEYSYDNSKLELDGFGFTGSYTDEKGNITEGVYYTISETCVTMIVNNVTRYFDLNGAMFTLRGEEYGVYLNTENGFASYDLYFELDGYSIIKTFTIDGNGNRDYVWEGTYTKENDRIFFTYKNGAETIRGEYALGKNKFVRGGKTYGELIVLDKDIETAFVNPKDWSILLLDDAGGAVKINKGGSKQTGRYTLITEKLLHFKSDDNEQSCIYSYNKATGEATVVELKGAAYYTEALEALLFDNSGFVVRNSEETFYYSLENGNVTIYKKDSANTEANKYGFVEDKTFGKFEAQKSYEGKNYIKNSGFAIDFLREESTKSKYPVMVGGAKTELKTICFAPDGNSEFRVSGTVVIGSSRYRAYLNRETDEQGNVRIFLTVGTYEFDLNVYYKGESSTGVSLSTYEITSMRQVITAPAYKYLDNLYRYYVIYGAKYANEYKNDVGTLTVSYEFNEDGDEVSKSMLADFGEGAELYDANGNILKMNNPTFTVNEKNSAYIVEFEGDDGFTYRAVFQFVTHSAFRNTFGYYINYITRVETLSTEDGYTVETERYIGSDNKNAVFGNLRSVKLSKNGEAVKYSSALLGSDRMSIYFISRTEDDNHKITASVYYRIAFVLNSDTEMSEEGKQLLATYKSVEVTSETMTVASNDDGTVFFEANGDGEIILLIANGKVYIIGAEAEYDTEKGEYTIVHEGSGKTFRYKLSADKTTIYDFVETLG